jgi:hypothetical protein
VRRRWIKTNLFGEILKQRHISPSFHIAAFKFSQFFKFGLFRVFVEGSEKIGVEYEIFVAVLVVDFDVCIIGVDTET